MRGLPSGKTGNVCDCGAGVSAGAEGPGEGEGSAAGELVEESPHSVVAGLRQLLSEDARLSKVNSLPEISIFLSFFQGST